LKFVDNYICAKASAIIYLH